MNLLPTNFINSELTRLTFKAKPKERLDIYQNTVNVNLQMEKSDFEKYISQFIEGIYTFEDLISESISEKIMKQIEGFPNIKLTIFTNRKIGEDINRLSLTQVNASNTKYSVYIRFILPLECNKPLNISLYDDYISDEIPEYTLYKFTEEEKIRIRNDLRLRVINANKSHILAGGIKTDTYTKSYRNLGISALVDLSFLSFEIPDHKCNETRMIPSHHYSFPYYTCAICGKKYRCSCFENAFLKFFEKAKDKTNFYYNEPHDSGCFEENLKRKLDELKQRYSLPKLDKICEMCRGFYPLHDSAFIEKKEIELGILNYDLLTKERQEIKAQALEKLRTLLGNDGVKWKSQSDVVKLAKDIFKNFDVIPEGSPDFIKPLRYDAWIPALSLAIEYQGEQHYQPIEIFGGEEGLKKTKQRDRKKLLLSKKNSVIVLYIKYDEPIDKYHVMISCIKLLKKAPPCNTDIDSNRKKFLEKYTGRDEKK